MIWQPGDKAWYRYGTDEQVKFTTPVIVIQTTKRSAWIAVLNRKTRRVIKQCVYLHNLTPRSVSHPGDASLEAYRKQRAAQAAERGGGE